MVNVKGLSYIKCTLVVIQISMGGGVLSMTPLPISLKNGPFSMPRAFVWLEHRDVSSSLFPVVTLACSRASW
jgi:hypothetical protein